MINRVLIFMILFALISCKKDEIINPYDHPDLFPVVTEDSPPLSTHRFPVASTTACCFSIKICVEEIFS